jgi:hypothetical protein
MSHPRYLSLIVTCLILFWASSCSERETSPSERKSWYTDDQGWLLMKNEMNQGERFFAIGTWHVPGYTFTKEVHADSLDYLRNAQLFNERTSPFNMVFVTSGLEKDYMSEKIHILNPFSPMLHAYLDRFDTLPKGDDKDYYRSQLMKQEVDNPAFIHYLDSQIVSLLNNKTNDKYIFSHIDEIALGGVGKWAVPPETGKQIFERLKVHDPEAIVFVDLVGHAKGSSYLFEKQYLRSNKQMPDDPPYELINENARKCKMPLLGFFHAYDGTPVYEFDEMGNYSYTKYDNETLKRIWFENLKIFAEDYKSNGNVFGINAFRDFFALPELAGLTVDALKEGLGDEVPLWIYFDGNGYAKPANISPADYLVNVKCQIYTAIIHGATGVLFWNDWSKTPEVFDHLLPIMEELKNNLAIIKLDTEERVVEGNQHMVIKRDGKKRFVIATNSSKTDVVTILLPDGTSRSLDPLEVCLCEI